MTLQDRYTKFLQSKIKIASNKGFEMNRADMTLAALKPHCIDIAEWACNKGCALIAASFGLHKTRINIEVMKQVKLKYPNSPILIIAPLNIIYQFRDEDGPPMGIQFQYIRNREEQYAATTDYHITNYERVRDGDLDLSLYQAVGLDEGSCLRSLGSDTTQQFILKFKSTQFKFVYTATPSPNEYLELLNYAEFLGVMDRGQALTRFFKRDSQKAGNLTIHPQHEEAFWLWISSWAIFITKPSDLGHSDEGYELPPLNVHYHLVDADQSKLGLLKEKNNQIKAFADTASSLPEAAKIKRASIDVRLAKAMEIIAKKPECNWLLWHLLEDERKAIEKALPNATTVYGKQDLEEREEAIMKFSKGLIPILATKPEIAGSGCNFQRYCSDAIFMSVNDMFNDFIQAVHRLYRFLQTNPVNIHVIYTREEQNIINRLKNKWARHNKQQQIMTDIVKKYGLHHADTIAKLSRSFILERKEIKGANYTAINNDSVLELENIESNSIGLIHTSIPFGNHYEYTDKYNDLGHNESNEMFWKQMEFMLPNWFRVLSPGRNAIVHVKDRIRYNTMTGLGSYTIDPFSDETVTAMRKAGFLYIGRITIVTDVVRENNQTYRLGWTEKCKDASKMGCGLPEYLLLFRKPQSDLSKGFADLPVQLDKASFSLAKWQTNASSFWRSGGNRQVTPEDLAGWPADKVYKWFRAWSLNETYDADFHVAAGEALTERDKLSKTYASIAPESWNNFVWTSINSMIGLNAEQTKKKVENHICPLPFDIVQRVIDTWSMEGDLVLDPFGGLMTVPLIAIRGKRKGIGIELNSDYFKWGCQYLKAEEQKQAIPTLFDALKESAL